MPHVRFAMLAASLALLSACQGEAPPAADASAAPEPAAQAAPVAPAVAGMDPAKLANPCLLDAKAVGDALGFAVEKAEPKTMGAMSGCNYQGANASLRLNLIAHDPAYFDKATQMTRASRPGDKRDLPGDGDKAWIQQEGSRAPILHYYRQNVEVELLALGVGGDSKAIEAALLKLPRVP
ncbi:hypothetical protein [Novosphingobium sp.]|uniref:hypothetical protein n=1 Tax=Novosphingobium sp. TaxID=1874826 RepID=UPI0025E17A48|nr:hypothetical protein [Novosphingobium sp.]MCC6926856.1 hypothetical protein [Novosphingobium sp.]